MKGKGQWLAKNGGNKGMERTRKRERRGQDEINKRKDKVRRENSRQHLTVAPS